MWNKGLELDRPAQYHGYHIQFVHGHTTPKKQVPEHIICLDDHLGKAPKSNKDKYKIFIQPLNNPIRAQINNPRVIQLKIATQQIQKKFKQTVNPALNKSAETLYDDLQNAIDIYINNPDFEQFKNSCVSAIKTARPV